MPAFENDLLLTLYDTVQRPARWTQFLDQICTGVGVRSAVIQRIRGGGPILETTWLVTDSHSEDRGGQHALVVNDAANPRMRYDYSHPPAPGEISIACDEDLIMPDHVRRRFQDDLRDVGLGKGIFAGLDLAPTEGVSLVLHRHAGQRDDYSSQERAFLAGLMPHLCQAIRLSDQLHSSLVMAHSMGQVLDRIRPALLVCDAQARLIWANDAARAFLKPSGVLRVVADRVTCHSHDRTLELHQLIRRNSDALAADTPDKRCLVLDDGLTAPTQLVAMPLPGSEGATGAPAVALFLSGAGTPFEVPARLLEKLFRLSPAEARLAKAIAEGGAVNTYAAQNGLAEGTVRFQLKQVLAKTGAPRQSDLVRLICSTMVGHFAH
ncbi:hypothetical protein ABAC460_15080 [Asticcacaulis sp. AC460]|uniref:helix-turn-helix transcriptional regulator n=1 Tax=Asticcacaulis sp. AC460 TaxID=1282360 RepID=UPI0003C3AD31|nr:hypothetical protein [Asticcacaulis sp. AC460]ESQ88613.1 hypothetical protein ABAC460_15080 [Asticcacaulis sp. AC460]